MVLGNHDFIDREFRDISHCNNRLERQATRLPRVRAMAQVRMKFVGMSAKRHSKPRLYLIEAAPRRSDPGPSTILAWHPVYQWGQNIISRMV
jgi:hypothetical protein